MLLNVLGQRTRIKASDVGEEPSSPTQRAACHLELPRDEAGRGGGTYHDLEEHSTSTRAQRSSEAGQTGCPPFRRQVDLVGQTDLFLSTTVAFGNHFRHHDRCSSTTWDGATASRTTEGQPEWYFRVDKGKI